MQSMYKNQSLEDTLLDFVINAPAGSKLCYSKSANNPSWLVVDFVEQLYKRGYVHKEQQNYATGINHYYIVKTLRVRNYGV